MRRWYTVCETIEMPIPSFGFHVTMSPPGIKSHYIHISHTLPHNPIVYPPTLGLQVFRKHPLPYRLYFWLPIRSCSLVFSFESAPTCSLPLTRSTSRVVAPSKSLLSLTLSQYLYLLQAIPTSPHVHKHTCKRTHTDSLYPTPFPVPRPFPLT